MDDLGSATLLLAVAANRSDGTGQPPAARCQSNSYDGGSPLWAKCTYRPAGGQCTCQCCLGAMHDGRPAGYRPAACCENTHAQETPRTYPPAGYAAHHSGPRHGDDYALECTHRNYFAQSAARLTFYDKKRKTGLGQFRRPLLVGAQAREPEHKHACKRAHGLLNVSECTIWRRTTTVKQQSSPVDMRSPFCG